MDTSRKLEHAQTDRQEHAVQPVLPPLASLGLLCRAMSCRAELCVVMRGLVGLTEAHVLSANSD